MRKLETEIRKEKDTVLLVQASGDDVLRRSSQVRVTQLTAKYEQVAEAAGLRTRFDRTKVEGYSPKHAQETQTTAKRVLETATLYFPQETTDSAVKHYLKEKSVIDFLESHGIKYKQRISADEIIVDAGRPTVVGERTHAIQNRQNKIDRSEMTLEIGQSFVDNAKLTLYQVNRETLKFLADNGYVILNMDREMVTAVPQKWRHKYDKFLGGK